MAGYPRVNWSERIGTDYELLNVELQSTGESQLTIKCKVCGDKRTISTITLRKRGKVGKCERCDRTRREVEKNLLELAERTQKDEQKARRRIRTKQIEFKFCSCGALLESGRTVCDDCKHDNLKEIYRRKDVVRRARMRTVPKDKGITLRKLYQRDNGVCYLCGRVCDWNDCRWDGKTFIVGKNYPTVEHLIPIVQGGSDTWENIRLACLSCNSKKGGRAIA